MGMIRYDAVDLPRRDGVVVAYLQHGKPTLETCPYEVIWDGTSARPLGRLLAMDEETRRPKPSRLLLLLERDLPTLTKRPTTSHDRVVLALSRSSVPMTANELSAKMQLKIQKTREALKGAQRHGRVVVVVVGTRPGPHRAENLYALPS